MRNIIARKWHEFTTEIWHEGFVIGKSQARREVIRKIRHDMEEHSLKGYKQKHLQLGYQHALDALEAILTEIEETK